MYTSASIILSASEGHKLPKELSPCVERIRAMVLGRTDVVVLYMEVRLNMGVAMCYLESSQLWSDRRQIEWRHSACGSVVSRQ